MTTVTMTRTVSGLAPDDDAAREVLRKAFPGTDGRRIIADADAQPPDDLPR